MHGEGGEKVEMVAQTLRNCGGQPNPAPPSTDCSFQKCSRPKWQRGLKKKFPAHFLLEKMNARKKRKRHGSPQRNSGSEKKTVSPNLCDSNFLHIYRYWWLHPLFPPHQSTEIVARHLDLKIYFHLTSFQWSRWAGRVYCTVDNNIELPRKWIL